MKATPPQGVLLGQQNCQTPLSSGKDGIPCDPDFCQIKEHSTRLFELVEIDPFGEQFETFCEYVYQMCLNVPSGELAYSQITREAFLAGRKALYLGPGERLKSLVTEVMSRDRSFKACDAGEMFSLVKHRLEGHPDYFFRNEAHLENTIRMIVKNTGIEILRRYSGQRSVSRKTLDDSKSEDHLRKKHFGENGEAAVDQSSVQNEPLGILIQEEERPLLEKVRQKERKLLKSLIRLLGPDDRRIIKWRYPSFGKPLTWEKIGEKMKLSLPNARMRGKRAKARLKKLFSDYRS